MIGLANQYVVVLDACVLAPMPVADTLLRLAEEPAFFLPRWSREILNEVHSALIKLGRTTSQADRRIAIMEIHFEEALVTGFESLIPAMPNHEKDRHVLAAAVCTSADAIVTSNARDFPKEALAPYSIDLLTPDDFLVHQFHLDPDLVIEKLEHQAKTINRPWAQHLNKLAVSAPVFVSLIQQSL